MSPRCLSIECELTELLYRQARSGFVYSAIAGGMLAAALAVAQPPGAPLLWYGILLATIAGRALLGRAYARIEKVEPADERRWHGRFCGAALTTAVAWAVAGVQFFDPTATIELCFLFATFTGLTAGAAFTLAPAPRLATVFVSIILVPLAIRFFLLGEFSALLIAMMVLLFNLFLLIIAHRQHVHLRDSLRLQHENARIVEHLTEAKDEAERANKARGDFLATVSHELRTPLNGILGMVQILQSSSAREQHREEFDTIAHSAEILLALLNDILDFAKIEAGRMELEAITFDLHEVLQQCANVSSVLAGRKGIEFRAELEATHGHRVVGDPVRIRQILLNLLGNAAKFTPEGHIRFWAEAPAEDDGPWRFHVEDTGIGMTEEVQARVFHRFTQGDSSMNRRFGGTGLGLSISHDLAVQMGGRLTVRSAPDEGSTFSLSLPLVPAAPATAAPTAEELPAPLQGRILIVEDTPVNRRVLALLLADQELELAYAEDGETALAQLGLGPWDLVLMDLQLPGINGLELTRRVRAGEIAGVPVDLPIIATTASPASLGDDHGRGLGIDRLLGKPIRKPALLHALRAVLERRARHDHPRSSHDRTA